MAKFIEVQGALVEKRGNSERTGQMWQEILERIILARFQMELLTFDLSAERQIETDSHYDRGVVFEASQALLQVGVGVKDATITLGDKRRLDFPQMLRTYDSPNAIGRALACTDTSGVLRGGMIVREAIYAGNIPANVRSWKRRIKLYRKATGGIYSAKGLTIAGPGKLELVFRPRGAEESTTVVSVRDFDGPGGAFVESDTELEMSDFLDLCFRDALESGLPLYCGAKDTIEPHVHRMCRNVFSQKKEEYADRFREAGLTATYLLIDDLMSNVFRPGQEGGFAVAVLAYDGDVQSDAVLAAMGGSLAMMRSGLYTATGIVEHEVGHGTVTRHYKRALAGERPPTNPMAQIGAWAGAISARGKKSKQPEVVAAARLLMRTGVELIEGGVLPGDIIELAGKPKSEAVSAEEFIAHLAEAFGRKIESDEHLRLAERIAI